MTKTHKERLVELYHYMEQPQRKLAHKKFGFYSFNSLFKEADKCGTIGCMAGELPALFPEDWSWNFNFIELKGSCYLSTIEQLAFFFGLTKLETQHLFYPGRQFAEEPQLKNYSTKAQVVKNFKKFLIEKNIL
jgi:hypothetical protein